MQEQWYQDTLTAGPSVYLEMHDFVVVRGPQYGGSFTYLCAHCLKPAYAIETYADEHHAWLPELLRCQFGCGTRWRNTRLKPTHVLWLEEMHEQMAAEIAQGGEQCATPLH